MRQPSKQSKSKNYAAVWFQGLSEKEKAEMIQSLLYSPASRRLQEILESWEKELKVTRGDYENPAWAYRQAHENGMLEVYSKLKKLFDHGEQNG